jgi:hypothetical protein
MLHQNVIIGYNQTASSNVRGEAGDGIQAGFGEVAHESGI